MKKVLIVPENIELTVEDYETILESGLKKQLNLPHGCKNGACGACKCKVISGEIELDLYNHQTLTDEELHQGYTLLCKARPKKEVVVEIPNLLKGFPIKTLPTRVEKIEKLGEIAILTLKLPANQDFGFYAGQYIEITFKGKNRSYSIASSPVPKFQHLEIHVRYYKGGIFSEFVWHELQEKQILRFRGPLGNFQLSDNHHKPTIFVCTGTGFAPIKAILQDMVLKNIKRELYVYWGNRGVTDFYLLDTLFQLQKKLGFKLTLCVSREKTDNYYNGYVTEAIINELTNLNDYEVYACGNLQMIESVYELATNKLGLAKESFFSDAFTPSI